MFAAWAFALLAAALMSPELLGHLKSLVHPRAGDILSVSLVHKVQAVRLFLLVISGGLVGVGIFRSTSMRGSLVSGAIWLAGALTVIQYAYPRHLLFRPRDLFRAALGEELLLTDYDPRSHLVVPSHEVLRAKYPVINIHAHFQHWYQHWTPEQLLAFMQETNTERIIDLDGGLGKNLQEEVVRYAAPHPNQFIIFASFWFGDSLTDWNYFRRTVEERLPDAKAKGAKGIKIWKNIGIHTRDEQGKFIALDDQRLEPLWVKAEALNLPILIHLADPPENFAPLDEHNESLEYLIQDEAISYHGGRVPHPEVVLAQFERVAERHPKVTFIAAHLANVAYDLETAGRMLDRHPNLYMDISSRANELGRQPVTARKFMIRYADRLLFGTDGNPGAKVYRGYFRLLETADEYFDDPAWPKFKFGRWKLYGLNLPDDVLRKLYHDNAAKLLGLPLLASPQASQSESRRTMERVR